MKALIVSLLKLYELLDYVIKKSMLMVLTSKRLMIMESGPMKKVGLLY